MWGMGWGEGRRRAFLNREENLLRIMQQQQELGYKFPFARSLKTASLEEIYVLSFHLCQEPWMYLHVNFECSLESFFYFPNLRLFLFFFFLSGGWMDILHDNILFVGFFLVLCFFFFFPPSLSFSNPVCVKFQSV